MANKMGPDEMAGYKSLSKEISCVEVLQPSQPNWVMSSMVSLPNHIFTGQT